MKPHQNLECWKQSFSLVIELYKVTKAFPVEEKFGITSQIRRAAVSIPVNIAEGAARHTPKEFGQFLYVSAGSASELDTLVLLCFELEFINDATKINLITKLDSISRLIAGLRKSLDKGNSK